MAQIIVRNLDEDVKALVRRRATRHGRSMEEEVREILRSAVSNEIKSATPLGSRLASRFSKIGLDFEIPEYHGEAPRPADFDT